MTSTATSEHNKLNDSEFHLADEDLTAELLNHQPTAIMDIDDYAPDQDSVQSHTDIGNTESTEFLDSCLIPEPNSTDLLQSTNDPAEAPPTHDVTTSPSPTVYHSNVDNSAGITSELPLDTDSSFVQVSPGRHLEEGYLTAQSQAEQHLTDISAMPTSLTSVSEVSTLPDIHQELNSAATGSDVLASVQISPIADLAVSPDAFQITSDPTIAPKTIQADHIPSLPHQDPAVNLSLTIGQIAAQKRSQFWSTNRQSATGYASQPVEISVRSSTIPNEATQIKLEPDTDESVFGQGFSWNAPTHQPDFGSIIVDYDESESTDTGINGEPAAGRKRSNAEAFPDKDTAEDQSDESPLQDGNSLNIENLLSNPTLTATERSFITALLSQHQENFRQKLTQNEDNNLRSQKQENLGNTAREIRRREALAKKRAVLGFNPTTGQHSSGHDFTGGLIEQRQAQGDEFDNINLQLSGNRGQMLRQMLENVPKHLKDDAIKQKVALNKAATRFGRNKVRRVKDPAGMRWQLRGLISPLFSHQLMGANWMLDRELSGLPKPGGILADAMGIGKTIQMIATMIVNKPVKEDGDHRTTLIVVRPSIFDQWMREIEKHAGQNLGHIAPFTTRVSLSAQQWELNDVILATYADVMSSYPFPPKHERNRMSYQDLQNWSQARMDDAGVLHQIKFYRVVLDEAHAIKNYKSITSQACVALTSQIKWAMSGTPIVNNLEELYAHFKFIGADMGMSPTVFKKLYGKHDNAEARARLQGLLASVMLRRTLDDRMMGLPLVNLPMAHEDVDQIEFSHAERILYDALEEKFIETINNDILSGVAIKRITVYVIMLLRLRQLTGHPFLLQATLTQYFSPEEYAKLNEKLKEEIVERNGTLIATQEKTILEYLGELTDEGVHDPTKCYACGSTAKVPVATSCRHYFCKSCFDDYDHQQEGFEEFDLDPCCPYCGEQCTIDRVAQTELNKLKKARKDQSRTHDSWIDLKDSLKKVTSTKTQAAMKLIHDWKINGRGIVINYERLDIVGDLCMEQGWEVLWFTGKMDIRSRADTVKEFESKPSRTILLCSLRAGGEGLNLNIANRVISLDLWWNRAAEDQAFGRIFRIGQQKETYMKKIIIKGTVDEKILEMQIRKRKVVTSAVRETGQMMKPFSLKEISRLFGRVVLDEQGNVERIERCRE